MPELPEVETIRRVLAPRLVGRHIESVQVRRRDVVGSPPGGSGFSRAVVGRRVVSIERRGKYLVFVLDGGHRLVFHLRLSGRLELVGRQEAPRYERVRFGLTSELVLSFVEPRALGRVYAYHVESPPAGLAGMLAMGPEPVEAGFTAAFLRARLRSRKAAVKTLLLDQRICCGVGNIYSDEALFRARVLPTRPAGSLSGAEVGRLAASLRAVLRDGIRWCGTTMADGRYRLPDGQAGGFQRRLGVFARDGETCRRCGTVVLRTRIGGRSSHYCPSCQS